MGIELKNLYKFYGEKENQVKALNDVTMTIHDGELVAIMGTSGAGKSTLLNIVGCIEHMTGGEYLLDGENISKLSESQLAEIRNKKIGFILQDYGLINYKSVIDNVAVPLLVGRQKYKKDEIKEKVNEALKKAGITSLGKRKAYKLSGGQKQRVAIARALVQKPSIILADEPTGSLDCRTSDEIMNELVKANENGTTILIVTHDENVAKYCKRVIHIEDGKII